MKRPTPGSAKPQAGPATAEAPARGTPSARSRVRRQRQADGKRRRIIGAGLEMFSRYGLHGASLDQIADRADVSKTNLLYYFGSKEELYLSVLRELLGDWLEPLRSLGLEQAPGEAIGEYVGRKLAMSRDQPEASRLFCLEMIQGAPMLGAEMAGELRDLVELKSEVVRGWIARGELAPVDPHHFIFLLWSTTQHYADFAVQVRALTGHGLDEQPFFDEALANIRGIVLNGVLPRR